MQRSSDALSVISGEFIERAREGRYRHTQLLAEQQQIRLIWLLALAFFVLYGAVDYLLLQRGAALLPLRLSIVVTGAAAVLVGATRAGREHGDLISFCALLLVSLCYALLVRERGMHGNPVGALLLVVVGIYMFSPGRFWLVCGNGLFCSASFFLILYEDTTASGGWVAYSYLLPANLLAALALARLNRARRQAFIQQQRLQTEVEARRRSQAALRAIHRSSRALLYNALPRGIARSLQRDPTQLPASHHAEATVVFADIVGFSNLSRSVSAGELLHILNLLFSAFDAEVEKFGLEKIKTIGDAYLAVAGVPEAQAGHEDRAAGLALGQMQACEQVAQQVGHTLRLRIGIHSGPVIAGVIGRTRYAFDVWGETVNIAARLEAAAQPGGILVSRSVREACAADFHFAGYRGLQLRGCGEIQACNLLNVSARPQ